MKVRDRLVRKRTDCLHVQVSHSFRLFNKNFPFTSFLFQNKLTWFLNVQFLKLNWVRSTGEHTKGKFEVLSGVAFFRFLLMRFLLSLNAVQYRGVPSQDLQSSNIAFHIFFHLRFQICNNKKHFDPGSPKLPMWSNTEPVCALVEPAVATWHLQTNSLHFKCRSKNWLLDYRNVFAGIIICVRRVYVNFTLWTIQCVYCV